MDSGVPQTSKRAGSRVAGAKSVGAKAKPAEAKGAAARPNGASRQGPVDPRTEDPSSPAGLARVGKTLWRRPGALLPRADKLSDSVELDAPIDFSVALPLAPVPADAPVARVAEAVPDLVIAVAPAAPAPSVETPTALVPTVWVPMPTPPDVGVTVATPILYDQAATIDDVTQIGPVLDSRPLRRPIQFRRAPKPRVRRVTRVVRHVDTWSVFKVAMVFSVFFYAVTMVAGVLLWQVAYATGTIDNVEKFFEGFGWETFKFNGGQIYHNAWIAGLFVAVGITGMVVLMATLFNLITDLVGGVRFSVLEEEVRSRAERGTAAVQGVVAESATETIPLDGEAVDPMDDPIAVESS
ncbi:MAG TPA: DUF3566 domain-containing protein [Ilumatobacteraceae bacterium]|nr:DUF3566 domain-containing protein [Ilumatobacteraceae bacterium]